MKHLKQKLSLSLYGYEPNVFLPIRVDNKLSNRNQFIVYKLKRTVDKFKR